ncbi:MAG: FAD:protein FMN transferase [Planctomycetota bacterium]|jgi:thiamine biosynthesis lipoprotein
MSSQRTSLPKATRRDFLVLGTGAFVLAALPAALRRRERLYRRSLPVMGTIAELAVVSSDARKAHAALGGACAELLRVDRTMTRFNRDSDVGRVNASPAGTAVPVRWETATVLTEALRWAEASDGDFDPCVGRVMELWEPGRRSSPPATGRVRRLAGRRFFKALDVNSRSGIAHVLLSREEASIDLGGIAKGWGVDRAAMVLREHGITGAIVNVGGDLRTLGRDADGTAWRIGVRSSTAPETLATTLTMTDSAVATSGDYENGFDHGGRRYHHLMDPDTASPRRSAARSVTVVAETCMTADAAATATFGKDAAEARRLLAGVAPNARLEVSA